MATIIKLEKKTGRNYIYKFKSEKGCGKLLINGSGQIFETFSGEIPEKELEEIKKECLKRSHYKK